MKKIKLIVCGFMVLMALASSQSAFANRPVDIFAFGGNMCSYDLDSGESRTCTGGYRRNQRFTLRSNYGRAKIKSGSVVSGKGKISCTSRSCSLTGVPSGNPGITVKVKIVVHNSGPRASSGGIWYSN